MSQDKLQGGSMGGVDDLYREVILDHFRAPKNRGPLPNANSHADGMNPLCGDQINMSLFIQNDKIVDIKFEGHGCAISQSAASMVTQLVKGKTIGDVKMLTQTYKQMFGVQEKNEPGPKVFSTDDLGDLVALEGVKKYPVRIKCALLSANTLLEGIHNFLKEKGESK